MTSSGNILQYRLKMTQTCCRQGNGYQCGDNHFAPPTWIIAPSHKRPNPFRMQWEKVTKGDQNKDLIRGSARLAPCLTCDSFRCCSLTGLVSSSEPALRATQVGVPECSEKVQGFQLGFQLKHLQPPPFLYSWYVERTWKNYREINS